MAEENKTQEPEAVEDMTQDYLNTIAELKRNSVTKDEYNKLKQENKNLLQTLVEGGQIQPTESEPEVDVDALRKELFKVPCELDNLEYIKKALQFRKGLMERGEPDPFLPVSSKFSPSAEEIAMANKSAEAYQSCVDYADGNSEIFTQELMRITQDSMPLRRY